MVRVGWVVMEMINKQQMQHRTVSMYTPIQYQPLSGISNLTTQHIYNKQSEPHHILSGDALAEPCDIAGC